MIGGFNTDIVLEGVVYHIQTEDKGAAAREVVTQIFREGAVVFTRRTPYPPVSDLLQSASTVEGIVRNQHSKLLQFVRAGGLKKKKGLSRPAAAGRPAVGDPEASAPKETKLARSVEAPPSSPPLIKPSAETRKTRGLGSPMVSALRKASGKKTADPEASSDASASAEVTHFLGIENIAPCPAPAPVVTTPAASPAPLPPPIPVVPEQPTEEELELDNFLRELSGKMVSKPQTKDDTVQVPSIAATVEVSQKIPPAAPSPPPIPILPAFAEGEKCEIHLLSSSAIRAGEVQPLSVRIQSDRQQLPIPDAKVVLRIFGKTIRPITYSGRSDQQGIFSVEILVPHYTVGDGHVEITAHAPLGQRLLRLEITKASASK